MIRPWTLKDKANLETGLVSGGSVLSGAIAIAAIVIFAAVVGAQAFLKYLPDPETVMRDIHGSSDADTAVRQYGALTSFVSTLSISFSLLTLRTLQPSSPG